MGLAASAGQKYVVMRDPFLNVRPRPRRTGMFALQSPAEARQRLLVVAQVSKRAVSPISKSAERGRFDDVRTFGTARTSIHL
jgi:hypothetical protein